MLEWFVHGTAVGGARWALTEIQGGVGHIRDLGPENGENNKWLQNKKRPNLMVDIIAWSEIPGKFTTLTIHQQNLGKDQTSAWQCLDFVFLSFCEVYLVMFAEELEEERSWGQTPDLVFCLFVREKWIQVLPSCVCWGTWGREIMRTDTKVSKVGVGEGFGCCDSQTWLKR